MPQIFIASQAIIKGMDLKRIVDLLLLIFLLPLMAIPMLLIAIAVKATSKGEVLYWSDRVGKNNCIFRMPKFRTMRLDTPEVATHLLTNPNEYLTPIGAFLRLSSLDELPQIYNVLRGELSLVGPRPALHNQEDLIALRTELGVHLLVPGLTGWAQINGRDTIPIPKKVDLDQEYLRNRSLMFDFKIMGMTLIRVFRREGIAH